MTQLLLPGDAGLAEARRLVRRQTRSTARTRYRDDPVAWAHDCLTWKPGRGLAFYQEEILDAIPRHHRVAARGPHGLGKAEAVTTPTPTPSGWTTMGALRVGDEVLSEHGSPLRVVSVSPRWWGDCWTVRFADGNSVVVHGNHEWNAVDVVRRPKGVTDWRDQWDATRLIDTRTMAATLRTAGGMLRWRVPTCRPLDLPEAGLPIDPYLLGIWLADGDTGGGCLTLNREDAPEIEAQIGPSHRVPSGERPGCVRVRLPGLTAHLRAAGVLGHKHIPDLYLRSSEGQRRRLLAGIMDGDGFRMKGLDGIDLCCKQFAADVVELIGTLGLVAHVKESDAVLNGRVVGRRWRINARFDECPYTLTRYRDGWPPRAAQASRFTCRTVVSIEPAPDTETVCITVDSPSGLYLTDGFIPTHNTTNMAIAVLWFATTRSGEDWKAVTTASAWRQLEEYLWPEVHKWFPLVRWDLLDLDPLTLLRMMMRGRGGHAFAVASDIPAKIEGAHADAIFYGFDEAKTIVPGTWDAAEGAFSGAGEDTDMEAFALAQSTPGEPQGRFYEIHKRAPGTEDWWVRHVTLDEAIAAKRISAGWAEQRRLQWGEESALYANRVLGEFASSDEDGVIPLAWAEAAVNKWKDAYGDRGQRWEPPSDLEAIGADIARSGSDRTVFARRYGGTIAPLEYQPHSRDTMTPAGKLIGILQVQGGKAIIDVIGVGAGVFDRVREVLGAQAVAFNASESPVDGKRRPMRDRSGEIGFANKRAAAWWGLREALEDSARGTGPDILLPPDDLLLGDLTAPHYRIRSTGGGQLLIEEKDEVRKRLGRSTDSADAVVQAFWREPTFAMPLGWGPQGTTKENPWRPELTG